MLPSTLLKPLNLTPFYPLLAFPLSYPICTTSHHKMTSPHLILDFDSTITTADTISLLFSLALTNNPTQENKKAHENIISKYMHDYTAHVNAYTPLKEERKTLSQEIAFQRSLKGVEKNSFERVSKEGIFRGVGDGVWRQLGRESFRKGKVVIREGFGEFVRRGIGESRREITVLSVSFQGEFVKGVVGGCLDLGGGGEVNFEVLANGSGEDGILRGPEMRVGGEVIVSSDEKVRVLRDLVTGWRKEEGGEEKRKVVYFGDSGTDLECLVEEGVTGIVMSEDGESSLMKTLRRVGVDVVHVEKYLDGMGNLYWARDFGEILESPLFEVGLRK